MNFWVFCMESCIFWISRLFGMNYWTFIWISMVLGFLFANKTKARV